MLQKYANPSALLHVRKQRRGRGISDVFKKEGSGPEVCPPDGILEYLGD